MATDDHPVLRNWRLLTKKSLVGKVIGHPGIGDDWIITGRLAEPLDLVAGTAKSATTLYRPTQPRPDDQPLPAAAHTILVARILDDVGVVDMAEMMCAFAAAEKIADKLAGHNTNAGADDGG